MSAVLIRSLWDSMRATQHKNKANWDNLRVISLQERFSIGINGIQKQNI